MNILSFDVGIKNLAYVHVLINESIQIQRWEVNQIPTEIHKIIDYLDTNFTNLNQIDHIVIEKQPGRNSRMKVIETILLTYFIVKNVPTVVSFNAKYKLGSHGKNIKGKHNYQTRKKLSIKHCEHILNHFEMKEIHTIKSSKKKDDLADCFLQALAYSNHESLQCIQDLNIDDIRCEKIISRKPTERQIRYGYSKSNIKFLCNQLTENEFMNDPKILKAVKKHFSNENIATLYNNLSI